MFMFVCVCVCVCACVCVCISVCVCGLLCSLFHPELCRKREDVRQNKHRKPLKEFLRTFEFVAVKKNVKMQKTFT